MKQIKKGNRRKGPDTMVKAISALSAITWVLILILFILITFAKPRIETFFDRYYSVMLGGKWDKSIMFYAFILMAILVIICFAGFIINLNRHRRKSDRYNKSLIFFGAISLLGMIYYLLFL